MWGEREIREKENAMYIIIAPLQVKEGFKEQFLEEMVKDAEGSVKNESGCLRFDIVEDPSDPNRIWLYEVYKDKAAFKEHKRMPHFLRWREATGDWIEESSVNPVIGGVNYWPLDTDWQ